ncbi:MULTISPECIES: TIGR04149 family rSAM-modified RiPP [Ulvibacterium]|uniref:RSAM-modified peptide n=1 Tax=Ulvibacterium marinum TaxID=2419782 RepID=A0A3B0C526_9FLAO|nr:TIGR04149 family rSAM-modified RiPP [Ulvibacterium marinum]RKN81123.1 rSAM-modified peptide [Ulvibacterium marinum]
MKKLSLTNLKKQEMEESQMKKVKGGAWFCYPEYYCGAYYCANVNPGACCCP